MSRIIMKRTWHSRMAALGLALLAGGVLVENANAQIEETRLTQPKIDPIPESDEAADQEGPTTEPPEDRAAILGMTIEAASRGRAVVTDVAVNSPAEGAGVKKGDHLLAINGLEIDNYEEWLDGVRRIIRDTPDGANVQVTVERRGRRANIPIKTLIAAAGARSQGASQGGQVAQPVGPGLVPQMPAEGAPGSSLAGGMDIFAANQNFFGAADSRPNERAIAHLYLLAGAVQALTPEAQSQQVDPQKDAAITLSASAEDERESSAGGFGAKGRIGIAGFRNRDHGMLVMVDVGMVPPGNYLVGIAEPSSLTGGQLSPEQPPARRPDQASGNSTTPGVGPQEGAPGAGNIQPPETIETPRQRRLQEPLRQVLDAPEPTAPTGPQEGAPASANPNSAEQPADRVTPSAIDAASAPGMTIPIGQLTVDQSGTGRMQDIVEGFEVGAVVGQAVVLYAMPADPKTAIPPGGQVVDSANVERTPGNEANQARQLSANDPMPVAAGLIELVDARGIEGQTPRDAVQERQGAAQTGASQGGQLQPLSTPGVDPPSQPGDAIPPPRN